MQFAQNALGLIGETPLVRLNRVVEPGGAQVLAKVEAFNPGGSVKDRIGAHMIEAAERAGQIRPGQTLVEPTSGNTGVGLAIAAAVKGYRLICTLPDKVPQEKLNLLRLLGAETVVCPTAVDADDPKSYYSAARRMVRERGAFLFNQYENPANPDAHYRTTGPEIWRDTDGRVDALVCGVGTGGTISGTGRFLKEQRAGVRVVGVDPRGSILKEYHQKRRVESTPHTYLIDGIGEDFVPSAVDFDVIDEFLEVTDAPAYEMAMRMARQEGLMVGSSGGAAVVGALEVAAELGEGKTVVVVLPDSGERYLSKLNDAWFQEQGLAMPAPTVR